MLGTKNAYGLIESRNLKADFADLADSMAKIGNLDERAAKGGDAIGMQLQVDEAGLGIDPQTAAAINGLKLKNDLQIDWVSGKPVYYNALGLGVGDENLMTLEVFTEGEAILIGLPEVLNQYIRIDPATLAGVTGGSIDAGGASTMLEAVTLMDMAIDRGALEDSLFQVAKILLDHVDSTEFKGGQELAVGSVTGSYDTYTITLGSESAKAMVIDILTFARGDDTLYNLIGRAVALSEGGSYEPVPLADYQSRIDEAIADMESTEITEPFTMYHTAYVDRNDNIVGRDFRVEDEAGTEMTHVRYAHPTDGASEAIAFELTSDGTDISFLSEYDVSGGLRNGAASMMSAGSEVLSMEFQNLDTVTKDGIDYLVGTVDITPAADAGVPVQSITYTGEMDGETYLLTLDVPGYVSLSIDFARIAAADVSIPDFSGVSAVDVTDSEALQGLMTEDAMNKLMEIVNQLGLPLEGITGTP